MIKLSFAALFFLTSVSLAGVATAGPAEKYVKGLVGKWRGGGTVVSNERGKKVVLRCTTTNILDKERRELTMKGRCASSVGKRSIKGSMKYSEDGSKLQRVSLSVGGRGGPGLAVLRGSTLVLNGQMQTNTGEMRQTRSVFKGGGNRYTIDLLLRDGGKFQSRGKLTFKR